MSIIGIDKTEFDLATRAGRRQALEKLETRLSELAEQGEEEIDKTVRFFELLDLPLAEETEGDERETTLDRVKLLRKVLKAVDDGRGLDTLALNDIEVTDREWLIPNWLPANTATLFTGDGGAGKSWLTLQVVCQIASGFNNAFLNPAFTIPSDADESVEPKHIVLATYEDEPEEIKRRIQALASGMNWIAESLETIKQHLHIVDMRGLGSVWGPGTGEHVSVTGEMLPAGSKLCAVCEEKHAQLLVLDPLSGAFGGNENDRTAVYDFVSGFRKWGDGAKCAIFMIGHLPKSSESRSAGFSGSTAWEASVRSMWMIEKAGLSPKGCDSEAYWQLVNTKNNYARLQDEIPLEKQGWGWWKRARDKDAAKEAYQDYKNSYAEQEIPNDDTEDDIPGF